MRKSLFSLVMLISTFCTINAFSQCEEDEFHDGCAAFLRKDIEHFLYLKSMPFFSELDKKIYMPLTLRKNTQYIITLCDEHLTSENITLKLYGPDRKKIIESNASDSKKNSNRIILDCTQSGKYYVQAVFPKSSEAVCCGLLLGMTEK